MIARQSLKSSMRNAPAKRKFPQPDRKIPLERDRKLNHAFPPSSIGTAPRTGLPHHAQSMRRRPHSSRYCAAARKIPHADGSPDSSRDRHRPQAPITPKRTARKIPRLPVHFGGPPSEPVAKSDSLCRTMSPFPRHYISIWTAAAMARMQEHASLPRFHKNFARPSCASGPFLALTWT